MPLKDSPQFPITLATNQPGRNPNRNNLTSHKVVKTKNSSSRGERVPSASKRYFVGPFGEISKL